MIIIKTVDNTIQETDSVESNCWTGLWTGLLDWTAGLDYCCSYHMTSTQSDDEFGHINCLMLLTSSHYMRENVHECTMHKTHRRMCIISSWVYTQWTHLTLWLHVASNM